jgi:hypothetical protein
MTATFVVAIGYWLPILAIMAWFMFAVKQAETT